MLDVDTKLDYIKYSRLPT